MSSCKISFSLCQELKNSYSEVDYVELPTLNTLLVSICELKFDYRPSLHCVATTSAIGRGGVG